MTYLVADHLPTEPAGVRFRKALEAGGILQIPGTHNGQAALQAARHIGRDAVRLRTATSPALPRQPVVD